MEEIRIVYITCSDVDEAKKIGKEIVEKRLAAGANVVEKISSFYWWKGKLQHHDEAVVIAKTKSSLIQELIKKVKAIHSYECPCIISLPVLEGNPDFLKWVREETKG